MLDKADGKTPEGEVQQDLAEKLLAGKYKTEEDLTKGILEVLKRQHGEDNLENLYKTLETSLGKTPSSSSKTEVEGEETKTPSPRQEETTETGIDFSQYEQEILSKGSLSEESYKALEEQGYPKQLVDIYIEGQKAIAERLQQEFYSVVGGQQNYEAMIQWASANLNEKEIESFNKALNTDAEMAKMATEALYNRYTKHKGSEPKALIQGSVGATGQSGGAYESLAQLTADMADPRYEKDPAFRLAVHEKLAKSNIL